MSEHEPRPTADVTIINDSSFTDDQLPLNAVEQMLNHHYRALYLGPDVSIEVTFIDEEPMEALHIEWLDLPGTTDVMSFPMDELSPGTADQPVTSGVLGDIVICPQVAHQQATEHSGEDEILLLATHGLLHLLGYDHHEEEEKTLMFELQNRLLTHFLSRPAPQPTLG